MRKQYIGSVSWKKTGRGENSRDRFQVFILDKGIWICDTLNPDKDGTDQGLTKKKATDWLASVIAEGKYKVVEMRNMNPFR